MSGSISFEQIPADWRVPSALVEVRPSYANAGVSDYPPRVLLIGAFSAPGNPARQNVVYQITRDDEAPDLFGARSMIAAMVQAFRENDRDSALFAVGLSNPGGGAAAAGAVAFGGSPTQAGAVALVIGGRRVRVPVTLTDTPTTLGDKLVAAIAADTRIPVTGVNTTGTVALTAAWQGTTGNQIPVALSTDPQDRLPPGMTATITAMANGAADHEIASALAAAADAYTDIVIGFNLAATVAVLEAELATRYGALGQLDARGHYGLAGTFTALTTAGAARNSQFMVGPVGMNSMLDTPWRVAAATAGVAAKQLAIDPARQLRGLALRGIMPPAPRNRFTQTEQNLLLRDGISTYDVLQDGTVTLSRLITQYQTTTLDVADTAWLDVMVPATLTRIRQDWRDWQMRNWPRHKLARDGQLAADFADDIVTPRIAKAAWATRCQAYERLGWIEDSARTAAESVFEINATDRNRLDQRLKLRIVGNLIVIASVLEFEA